MKRLFKKLAGLMMGLLAVAGLAGIGVNSNEAPIKAEAVTITGGTKLYLKPNSNWTQANAWFAAYFCNGSSSAEWYKMTDSNSDGIYEVTVSSGKSHKNVIFCRMNPAADTLDWSNRWNQTGDLEWPASGKDLCTINSGKWDCGQEVTWSTYSAPKYNVKYVVDGVEKKTSSLSNFEAIDFYEADKTRMVTQWYTDAACTVKINGNSEITKATTVYGKSVYTWSIIGTFSEKEWDTDNLIPLTYNTTSKTFEINIGLVKDDLFKIRYSEKWGSDTNIDSWRDDGKICDNLDKNIINDDGTEEHNIKVIKSGYYLISIKDDNVQNYGDESYGWSITEKTKTITYHLPDGTVESETASYFNPRFYKKEGKRLVGWYTDSDLTNEYKKGSFVTEDVDLYPKYIEAKEHTIYVYDPTNELGGVAYAYIWRDLTDGDENAAWPGVAMQKVEGTENYYSLNINDPSASYDTLIVNGGDGKRQSEKMLLTYDSTSIYTISTSESGDLPAETKTVTAAITADGVDETGYYVKDSEENLELVNYVTTEQKQIAFERYMTTVSTCDDWAKVEEFAALAEGLNTEVEIDDKEGKVTIQNKIEFMRTWKAIQEGNEETPELGSNLLSNITSSNNILIVLIVGLLGLTAVGAYYFLNKKKFAK